ncbi:MAG: ribose 5-phosphate isomerase A, partial [Thioclava sp.]
DGKVEIRDINEGTVANETIEFAEDENIFRDMD